MTDEAQADPSRGRVLFVGTGPGDPDLLTLAAARAIREADVLLADDDTVAALPGQAGVDVPLPVEVLDPELLSSPSERAARSVAAAEGGKHVVRLVVGDPFLDAGSAAEAAECRRAGVPFEVVPGVSPLTAVPEYAGIPLNDSDGVHFVGVTNGVLDSQATYWRTASTLVLRTVAGLAAEITEVADEGGRPLTDPVIATFRGGSTSQRSVRTTLAELAFAIGDVDEHAQMTLMIGDAAGERSADLAWFESKPLFGWRVLVPRTKDPSSRMIARLRGYGARFEEVPTISVERPRTPQQVDKAIRGLVEGRYEWVVFTSENSVRAVREKYEEFGLDARAFAGLRIAATTGVAAEHLRAWGIEPDLIVDQSAALADDFPAYDPDDDPIDRVLVQRADVATETLVEELTRLGWEVEDVTAYRTVRAAPPPASVREAIKAGQFDAILFSSSSTVRNFVGIAGKPHPATIVAVIGPATAKTCEEHGLRVDVMADSPSAVSLADGLADFAARRRTQLVAAGKPVNRPSQRRARRRS